MPSHFAVHAKHAASASPPPDAGARAPPDAVPFWRAPRIRQGRGKCAALRPQVLDGVAAQACLADIDCILFDCDGAHDLFAYLLAHLFFPACGWFSPIQQSSNPLLSMRPILSNHPHATVTFGTYRHLTAVHLSTCAGVLWKGSQQVHNAAPALQVLRKQGKQLLFCTNNASKSRAGQLRKVPCYVKSRYPATLQVGLIELNPWGSCRADRGVELKGEMGDMRAEVGGKMESIRGELGSLGSELKDELAEAVAEVKVTLGRNEDKLYPDE
ncbi:phosphoglycolate phosphatase, partial [Haematococcus lacustris]